MNVATLQVKDNAIAPRLYIAMELSNKSWKVVFSDGVKRRRVTIEAAGIREEQAILTGGEDVLQVLLVIWY
jgi:hypothetical protein